VVIGAAHIAQELQAQLVVVVSHTGATALALSKRRNLVPIVGISDRPETQRQMCLYWNVIPLTGAPMTDSHDLLRFMESWGQADGCLAPGDLIVLVAGLGLASRGHNMVRVHEVGGGV
jgi:pyruvate kinase